jgi:uncharacterized membrane protein YdfJ with MMPL/SSD domain
VEQKSVMGFSWDFLDEMTIWALVIGASIAVGGGVVLQSISFGVGCLFAVGVDVGLVRISTHRARRELEQGRIDSVAPTVMLAGRLVVKALLLVAALFVPQVLGFTGTVIGALTFDLTLAVVGSIAAASQTMHHPKEGR